MAVISVEDVSRRYGKTVALDGVSLTIERGEVFCLVGPNGAGKTTLVRAITGTTKHDGTVEVFGYDPRVVDTERIGFLPQDFSPPGRLTVSELLDYFGGLYEHRRPTPDVLADVGLEGTEQTFYEHLSGGQQRRVCVGLSLVNEPDLLVLDEPTTGIDPAGRRTLWEVLEGLADEGTTIFITTHYMKEAERLGDRVGLLASGQLAAVDYPAALVEEFGGPNVLEITGEIPKAISNRYPESTRDGNVVRIEGVSPSDVGEIPRELEADGVEFDSVTWRQPDLEDAYLALAAPGATESSESGDDHENSSEAKRQERSLRGTKRGTVEEGQ